MANAKGPLPDVFGYLDFRAYLRDWFDAKKLNNPRFSHRLFARKAGQRLPSAMLQVMEGRRNLTPASADGVVVALGLDAEESEFFQALVRMVCADDLALRDRAMEQVRATRRFREARRLDSSAIEYLSRWYLPAIRELAACDAFRPDPEWIAGALTPPIRIDQAQDALDLLFELGLLRKEADGRVRPAEASVVTPHEIAGLAVRQYHLGMIDRARDALAYPASDRHLCGVTVAIPDAMIPRLKKELDAFQERILELCDGASGDRSVVVQCNLQLVPLSVRGLGSSR